MADLRDYTQRKFAQLETQASKNGGLTTFRLPETGLGARLYLTISGTLAVALAGGTATFSPLGVGNILSRINVRLNDGTMLYEMEGFNANIPTLLQNGFDPHTIPFSRAYTSVTPFAAPAKSAVLAGGNIPILFTIEIPIMNNDKDMLGLILLQNGTTQATVEAQWNQVQGADGLSALVAVTGAATATFTGNIVPTLEFFSVPNLPQDQLMAVLAPHLRWTNQWKSEYEAITSTAPLKKKLERGSIYTKIAHRLLVNGLLDSQAPANFRLLMGGTDAPVSITRDLQLYLQKRNYSFDLPEGIFLHDFDRSYGIEEFGDHRDMIDSRQLTELTSEVAYNSGLTIGANSFIYTIVNKLVPVAGM